MRKAHEYKLMPTLAQQRELARVLLLCRRLYNTALEQRKVAWEWRHISLNRFQQEGELKDLRAELPECASIHSHILQDVLARLEKIWEWMAAYSGNPARISFNSASC